MPSNEVIQQALARRMAEIRQREDQQGLGRPIISCESHGYRLVFVGNRAYWSQNWKTFHDFLRDYPLLLFGQPWHTKEMKKAPADRHPYLQWRHRAFDDYTRLATKDGIALTGPMTSAISSIMALAYNLYLIHHNLPVGQKTKELCAKIVKRLKNPVLFWGALYETYAFALFAVAGFTMELEDESVKGTTHCEFSAHSKSGRSYSIECKSRNRATFPVNEDGSPRIDATTVDVSKKLEDALAKKAEYERVVFLDLDLPSVTTFEQFGKIVDLTVSQMRELETTLLIDNKPAPAAYVFVTNIPDHRNLSDASIGFQAFGAGFKIPDFGHSVQYHSMHELMRSRDRHADINSLQRAAKVRHTIPSTFDGSNPALAFSEKTLPPLTIGNWYTVPGPDGIEVEAQLCDAVVSEDIKLAHCIYRSRDGVYLHGTNTLTDNEIKAYRLHPETFFGVVKNNQTRKADTVVEWFDFLFETYQHTSKEKLLEFLTGMPDFDDLTMQSQRDLAITYCERMALHIHATSGTRKSPIDRVGATSLIGSS